MTSASRSISSVDIGDDAKAPIVLREEFDTAVAKAAPYATVLGYRSGRPKGRSVVVGEVMCLLVTLHIGGFGSDDMDLVVADLAHTIAHDL